jgi:hypothetical protein
LILNLSEREKGCDPDQRQELIQIIYGINPFGKGEVFYADAEFAELE